MESKPLAVLIIRWVQWTLGTISFGTLFAYFLTDVNFYLFIPTLFRAQLALSGILHIYLYLAAIWISVKPQGPMIWAVLDGIAAILAIAVAGTAQSNLSTYCSSSRLTLYFSTSAFAYVPLNQLASNEKADTPQVVDPSYMQRACGFHAFVVALSVILVILFATTSYLQIQQHRQNRDERNQQYQYLSSQHQYLSQSQQYGGWRKSLAPLRRGMNLEV